MTEVVHVKRRSTGKSVATPFFHFTSKRAVPKILSVGLKAQPISDWPEQVVGAIKGVWLTLNPEMSPLFSTYAEHRLEVVLPYSDKRLVHMRSWMRGRLTRKQLTAMDDDTNGEWQSFYLYLGDIRASRISGAEHYLDLAEIEACRSEYLAKFAAEEMNCENASLAN